MRQPLIDATLVATGCAAAAWLGPVPALAALAGLAGRHAWGLCHPRAQLYGPATWRCAAPGVALTFDDGPHPEWTPRFLDLLAEHGARATFFCLGRHARAQPGLLRRLRAEGHGLGLHGDRHDRLLCLRLPDRVRRELADGLAALADASGERPRLFRPPVGLRNPIVQRAAAELDLELVTWSARGLDTWLGDPRRIARRLLAAARPGAILLLHDGCEPGREADRGASLAALGLVLAELRRRGLGSTALGQA